MELLDLEPFDVSSHVFELAALDKATDSEKHEEEAEVDGQGDIVVNFTILATIPVFDLYAVAFLVKLLVDCAARVTAV